MLIKFGRSGEEIREYCLEDGSSIDDLLDIVNQHMDDDDIIHVSGSRHVVTTICEDDLYEYLEDGATYVLSTVVLTRQEEKMIALLDELQDDYYISDMSKADQKIAISKIVNLVHECSWDK